MKCENCKKESESMMTWQIGVPFSKTEVIMDLCDECIVTIVTSLEKQGV